MSTVKLSMCIVTHNSEDIICNTINKIIDAAADFDFKFYISDNCSTDNTVSVIKEKFPQVIVIENKENPGFGAGHNKVLPLLESKYHFIINPDILTNEDTFRVIVDFMENNNDVGMLCPLIMNDNGTEQILPKRNPKYKYLISRRIKIFKNTEAEYTRRFEKLDEVTDIDFCTGCFMAIRTELFKKLGGFDDSFFMYFEDADLSRRVKQTSRVVMYRKAQVIHKWERASAKSLKFLMIQIKSMNIYFKKWKNK